MRILPTMLLQYLILTSLLLFGRSLGEELPLAETSLGKIKGHYKNSYGGRIFSAFEGIPYGKPPIGDLRFEDPHPIEPWSGTWEATMVHECMQVAFPTSNARGSEDCLYLNVYVPKKQPLPGENLDVIVHIHGGAFMAGSPNFGGPEYLMDRNIVYATLNYRVGVLGFLSTQDDVVSGNMGMKDQVLALKWIQSHIHEFGGNPKSVTIIGLSAGGGAVHFHYFSPLSKGLFHRGMSQSGVALAPWAIQDAPLEMAKKISNAIGCDNPSTKEIVKCLKQRPASQVIRNSTQLSPLHGYPIANFAPVIEKQSEGAFLTDFPYRLLEHGNITDVPWITSETTEEGILGFLMLKDILVDFTQNWKTYFPYFLDYNNTVDESNKAEVTEKIKQFYFGNEDITHDNVQKLIKLCGDRHFNLDLEKSARMQAKLKRSPVYSYIYGYRGDHNFSQLFGLDNYYGVGHGEDGNLLYQVSFGEFVLRKDKLSESDEKIKEMFLDMVTSFAKTGKPEVKGVDWKPVSDSDDFQYLFIHNDGIKMVSKKEIAPTEFWKSLPIKENEKIAKP